MFFFLTKILWKKIYSPYHNKILSRYHRASSLRPNPGIDPPAAAAGPVAPVVQVAPVAVTPVAVTPVAVAHPENQNQPTELNRLVTVAPTLQNRRLNPPVITAPPVQHPAEDPDATAARRRPSLPQGTASYAQTYIIDAGQALIDRMVVFQNGVEERLAQAELGRIREILSSIGD
jgi:hypothetical protein